MNAIQGDYFDGRTAHMTRVNLALQNNALSVSGMGVNFVAPIDAVRMSEALGDTPRTLSFKDGGSVVVRDVAALSALFGGTLLADSIAQKAPRQTVLVLASVLGLLVMSIAGYHWGVPWVAQKIAHALPERALEIVSKASVDTLDSVGMGPSKLPAARQAEIIRQFRALKPPDGVTQARSISFRSAPEVGPNAIALPDGTMIVTDELVALAQNQDQILSVMTHELGHVAHRHGAQMIVESGIIAGFLALYIGDFSTIATGATATLLASHYSRKSEAQADEYAISMMKLNGIKPTALASILARMDHAYRAAKKAETQSGKKAKHSITDYFSSHPRTAERIQRLESATQ
jgi:Zn-dependent protease with chaperone function